MKRFAFGMSGGVLKLFMGLVVGQILVHFEVWQIECWLNRVVCHPLKYRTTWTCLPAIMFGSGYDCLFLYRSALLRHSATDFYCTTCLIIVQILVHFEVWQIVCWLNRVVWYPLKYRTTWTCLPAIMFGSGYVSYGCLLPYRSSLLRHSVVR
jgi:hypothetical protein